LEFKPGDCLELGALPPLGQTQKTFVITTAAIIFRALCRNRLPAAKHAKLSPSASRSRRGGRLCGPSHRGGICSRRKTQNENVSSVKWPGLIKRTKPESKPICLLVRPFASRRPLTNRIRSHRNCGRGAGVSSICVFAVHLRNASFESGAGAGL